MANQYLGEIRMFGGNFAPVGWALCNGQLLSIQQYSALFSLLGTTYGGNGTSTFALPNMQSRVPIHWGTGPGLSSYTIGEMVGIENVQLLLSNMPTHSHPINCSTGAGNQASPSSAVPAVESTGTSLDYNTAAPNGAMSSNMCGTAGSNIPHTNIQPVLCVTFIIALTGNFPSRN